MTDQKTIYDAKLAHDPHILINKDIETRAKN